MIVESKGLEDAFDFEKTTSRMRVADQGLVAAMNYIIAHQKLSPQTLQELTSPVQVGQQGSMRR
ncbi:MAG: hypothetical protein EBR02_00255 [Alphaproteobacteria bacterium]|nr:hypothetical protein [Alphaproteobacteria bacterium]